MDGHLWNVTETAQYLAVPVSAVYKMTSRGATTPIPHIKLGGRLRFVPSAVEEFVELWSVGGLERQARAVSRGKRVGRLGRRGLGRKDGQSLGRSRTMTDGRH